MAKKSIITITESYCNKHGRMLPIEEFHKSPNPFHESGVFPFCKKCAHEMVKYYIKKYGSLEAAMYYTCSMMGVPFILDIYEQFEDKVKTVKNVNNYFGNYIQLMQTKQNKGQAEQWIDFGASDIDLKDIKGVSQAQLSFERELKDLEYRWGKGYESEQYQFLEKRYGEWTLDKKITDYEDTQYRNLCKAQLIIHEDSSGDISDALKIERECAKILKLDQFEIIKEKTLAEQTIESKINLMEYNEPAEYFRNQGLYKDFRGIRSGWILELLRPFRNILTGSKDYDIEEDDMEVFDEKVKNVLEEDSNGN